MKSLKVTDKAGNVYVLAPVDTEARQAIDEAKNLQFDDDFFTSEVSQDQTTVSVGLNGVPIGIDTDSPLKFVQDNEQGIVFGSDAPFSTALAPEYDPTATYAAGDHCMHLGKYYRCDTAISTAEAWTPAHWTETDIIGDLTPVPDPTATSQMLFSTNGTAWTPMTWEVQKYATIGGKDYPTVTIGDQEWLAVNLDMTFSGLAVGESGTSTSASRANYLDNDGSTNGWTGNRDGLLYNWTAVNYMETNKATLFPGWHVPTAAEYDTLATTLGAETAGTQLKSTSGWSENNGDGSTEFNARPVGNYDGTFVNTGSEASFWTISSSGDNATAMQLTTGATVTSASLDKGIQCSVRLVKDSA